jgi:hypothetical protein
MKKLFNCLLVAVVFLFSPLATFACEGDGIFSIDPISIAILVYALFAGIVYFMSYKKFLDNKWSFLQYVIFFLIMIPSLLPAFFLSLLVLANLGAETHGSAFLFFLPIIPILIITFLPLIFRKRWIYIWGIPLYLLIITLMVVLVSYNTSRNALC